MGQILLDIQRRFPDQLAYLKDLDTQVVPLAETRLAELEVRTKLQGQPEVEALFSAHPSAAVAKLVTSRGEVLEDLQTQCRNLTRALAVLEA